MCVRDCMPGLAKPKIFTFMLLALYRKGMLTPQLMSFPYVYTCSGPGERVHWKGQEELILNEEAEKRVEGGWQERPRGKRGLTHLPSLGALDPPKRLV